MNPAPRVSLPQYTELRRRPNRHLPSSLVAQEHQPVFRERSDAIRRDLLSLPSRRDDSAFLTTLWADHRSAISLPLPEGGYGLLVFSRPALALDYVNLKLPDTAAPMFRVWTPIRLAQMLAQLRTTGVGWAVFDRCPRCEVVSTVSTQGMRVASDVLNVWAIGESLRRARTELYLKHVAKVAPVAPEEAKEIALETAGHIAPDDHEVHVALGVVGLRLGDRGLVREACDFLRFLKHDAWAERLSSHLPLTEQSNSVSVPDRVFQAATPVGADDATRSLTTESPLTSPRESRKSTNAPDYSIGDLVLGVFRVKRIVSGGMGVVYIVEYEDARASNSNREFSTFAEDVSATGGRTSARQPWFAVKTPHRADFVALDAIRRFERECLVWATLPAHPNVVRAFVSGRIGSLTPYVLLEYVDGGNLREFARRVPLLPEILGVMTQLCRGMRALHREGVIHGDLKPENVLLTHDGVAKVTDLGLVRVGPGDIQLAGCATLDGMSSVDATEEHGHVIDLVGVESGLVAGSLPYMAPEQFTGCSVHVGSDVYAFGVVLYELLARRRPFVASSAADYGEAHRTAKVPPFPQELAIPQRLVALALQCLQKLPEDRPAGFDEVGTSLVAIAHEEGLLELVEEHEAVSPQATAAFWLGRGQSLLASGRALMARLERDAASSYLTSALTCFRHATELDNNLDSLDSAIGNTLLLLQRHEEAIKHFRRQIDAHPKDTDTYLALSKCLTTLGLTAETLAVLSDGLQHASDAQRIGMEIAILDDKAGHKLRDAGLSVAFGIPPSNDSRKPRRLTRLQQHLSGGAPSTARLRLMLPGWIEEPGTKEIRMWRSGDQDVISVALVPDISLPDTDDANGVREWWDGFSRETLIDSRAQHLNGVTSISLVYKRLVYGAFVFTGMTFVQHRLGVQMWTVVAGERGTKIGTREERVAAQLQSQAAGETVSVTRPWTQKQYEASFTREVRGVALHVSDHEQYDSLFPWHPLSRVRAVLAALPTSVAEQ